MTQNITTLNGTATPLGCSINGQRVNFALFSKHAERAYLGLFSPGNSTPLKEYPLNRTGDTWHIGLEGSFSGLYYAFRLEGPFDALNLYRKDLWVADPYAKSIDSPLKWNFPELRKTGPAVRAPIATPPPFDWQGVSPPQISDQDLIIYEAHVRGFTRDPSSQTAAPGTYLALIDKIPYLKKLGINAIELMPVFEFDETHSKNIQPKTLEPLPNYWGYNSLHFFVPMKRYASHDAILEFKTMVRELHRNEILVFLDVVYNHTGEGKEKDYCVHFRGIDNQVYYQVLDTGVYRDYTGCGNTVNANEPVVQTFILDSLRYWAKEMRVDGFRFDLGAALTRAPNGEPLSNPPLIEAISKDPVLSKKKLIAETWDAVGLYLLGTFPQWGPWHEWNGQYRDRVRRFIKGTDGYAGQFAASLCGSEPIYSKSGTPLSSINFITTHDGYSLYDLVSYQQKHNYENGEMNRDGNNQNDSWNCGVEGPSEDPKIQTLREKQMRNFLLALFLSQGIPMLLMGDEHGHTRKGNNNPYVQDNEINWLIWDKADEKIASFTRALIDFRKKNPIFRRTKFLTDKDIAWHGHNPNQADWGASSRFVAFSQQNYYAAFNADHRTAEIKLPEGAWKILIDTSKGWIDQPLVNGKEGNPFSKIVMEPYSAVLMRK